jgi:hypothetical protein
VSETWSIVLDYLQVSPVKKIATLEVLTEHTLQDDYFQNYKIIDYDVPENIDRLISQIKIEGKVKVNAVYGYTADQVGVLTDPKLWWEPKLLYYEIVSNNIDQVIAGFGVTNNALVKRVVNVALAWIHDNLKSQFASNTWYLLQAKENALCKFGGICGIWAN